MGRTRLPNGIVVPVDPAKVEEVLANVRGLLGLSPSAAANFFLLCMGELRHPTLPADRTHWNVWGLDETNFTTRSIVQACCCLVDGKLTILSLQEVACGR